jgi:type II secretory pathway pseudopilin PulG
MPPATRKEVPLRRVGPLSRLLRSERGISMVEVVIALVLLEIVGASMVTMLTSATAATTLGRQRTIAQQSALSQIEAIRAMDYNNVGIVAGNPAGCLGVTTPTAACPNSSYPPSTATVNDGGLIATLATSVSYVNDPGPLSYTSYANYKKIVVTVTRNRDSKELAREVTYVAPPVRASQSNAVINARVVDYGNSTQVADVPVALETGPDAPRNDVTDASGTVLFAGLTPNPTSGATAYYDLSLTPPTGYDTLYDTVSPSSPAHVQLSPGQTWPTALYVYKPATIYVDLRNADGTAFTGAGATVTVSYTRNSTNYSKTFSYPGSILSVTSMTEGTHTVDVIPGLSYTVSTGGSFIGTPVTANVPDSYPTVMTHTFTLTNQASTFGTVQVKVQRTRLGVTKDCKNATVTVTGGPFGGSPWNFTATGTTDASGNAAVIAYVPVGSSYTVKGHSNVTGADGTLSNVTVAAGTNNLTPIALTSGSNTC